MRGVFTLVLAALTFVGCSQRAVEEIISNKETKQKFLTIGFEGGDDTRIRLNAARKTIWNKGDEVSAFYQKTNNIKGVFQGETGDREGLIAIPDISNDEPGVMAEYVIVYPYNANYLLDADNLVLKASTPTKQSYLRGGYGTNGNIMVDAQLNTHFTLRSIYGWLRIELTGNEASIKSITLRGNSGEQLAGSIAIDLTTYAATFVTRGVTTESDMAVTLDCGDGVTLGSTPTEFYIGLLPQCFDRGFTLDIADTEGNIQTLSTERSITIKRNTILPMAVTEFTLPTPPEEPTPNPEPEPMPGYDVTFGADYISGEYYGKVSSVHNYYIILSDKRCSHYRDIMQPDTRFYCFDIYASKQPGGGKLPEGTYKIDSNGTQKAGTIDPNMSPCVQTNSSGGFVNNSMLGYESGTVTVTNGKIVADLTLTNGEKHYVIYEGSLELSYE